MAVKAELERSCIIGPVLKTFIYSLVKSKNLSFRSTMEDLDAVMQNMLGCLPHVSLRAECCGYRFHIAAFTS